MKPLLLLLSGAILILPATGAWGGEPIPICLHIPGPVAVGDDAENECPPPVVGPIFSEAFDLWGAMPPVMLSVDGAHVSSSRRDSVFVNDMLVGLLPSSSHDCNDYASHFLADITAYVSLGPNVVELRAGSDAGGFDDFWFRDLVISGCQAGDLRMIALNDIDQATGTDEIRTVDYLGDGVTVPVGPLGPGYYTAEAMTTVPNINPNLGFGPDRLLAADDDWLIEIDQITGAATPVGPIGFPDVDGLGFDVGALGASSDEFGLYGVTYSTNQLISINPFSGAGVLVADDVIPGRHLNAIAFRPTDGAAFVLTETQGEWRVYQIDKTTGDKIDRWILEGATSFESLLWSLDGNTLYSAGDRNGTKDLVTIELTPGDAGIATFVGAESSGAEDIEALTWIHAPIDPTDGSWKFRPIGPTDVVPLQAVLNDDLLRPAPNPFVNATRIVYAVPEGGRLPVSVNVYDVTGRRIRDLVNTESPAGQFSVTWDGRSDTGTRVAGGVYFFRVTVGREAVTHRVVRLR